MGAATTSDHCPYIAGSCTPRRRRGGGGESESLTVEQRRESRARIHTKGMEIIKRTND